MRGEHSRRRLRGRRPHASAALAGSGARRWCSGGSAPVTVRIGIWSRNQDQILRGSFQARETLARLGLSLNSGSRDGSRGGSSDGSRRKHLRLIIMKVYLQFLAKPRFSTVYWVTRGAAP